MRNNWIIKIIDLKIAITAIVLLLLIFYILIGPSKDEILQNKIALLEDIVNRDIDELSIVIYENSKYSYLKINDKKIIIEFMNTLKNDAYIPDYSTGQYNSKYVITLHSKNNSDLIKLSSDTFNDNIESDSVEVTLFDVKNIDIFDMYCKSTITGENFFSLFIVSYGSGKYDFRNKKLYYVIKKYFKSKGLVYNPSTKKWIRGEW